MHSSTRQTAPLLPFGWQLSGLLLCALLAFAAAAPLSAAARDVPTAFEGFDAEVEAWMLEWKVPGLGVSVVHDGEVVLARGYGYRNLEDSVPATADTLFAIGSNTKSFTVTLLGMLADDKTIDWDTPVREYMPDFRMKDPVASAEMTPRDLVTHRSGLPRHDLVWYASGLSRKELFQTLRYLEPSAPFRSRYQYQNLMFMTAGYLAERVTGKTWEQLVDERVFAPLGMERSNFSVDVMQEDADFSYPYLHQEDEEIERVPFRNIDAVGPAGSINSSAKEMARYVQFHIDHGKVEDSALLSEATARSMQSPQMPITGPQLAAFFTGVEPGVLGDPSYGMGLMVSSYRGRKHVRHGGGIDGFISAMEWLPHDRIGVVVLSNSSGSGTVPQLVVRSVFDRLLGLEPIDWANNAREQEADARVKAEEAEKTKQSSRREGTGPSHELAEYTGIYSHPAYGRAEVRLVGGRLEASAAGLTAPLEHYHYDVFEVPEGLEGDSAPLEGTQFLFLYDRSGVVNRLTIPLEPSVADIVFERLPEETDTGKEN